MKKKIIAATAITLAAASATLVAAPQAGAISPSPTPPAHRIQTQLRSVIASVAILIGIYNY